MAENRPVSRPLSPHLMIYRRTITMVMSIVHRMTGVALYAGTVLFAWWLLAVAAGPEAYETFQWFMGSILGWVILGGFTWAILHHMLGGVRHLLWDTITAIDVTSARRVAWATVIGSATLTVLVWIVAFILKGAM